MQHLMTKTADVAARMGEVDRMELARAIVAADTIAGQLAGAADLYADELLDVLANNADALAKALARAGGVSLPV